jgi:cytochrome c oxidase cbb3-type subunit 3
MNQRAPLLLALLSATACAPGRPAGDSQVIPPGKIVDFRYLYASNCAGCHGTDGKGGLANGLSDPVYLAIADDAAIRRVTADGVPGNAMPAFAQASGGMLTEDQINVIVGGIRAWAKPDALRDASAPPYAATAPGDPKRGAAVYATYCASCHGADGRGDKRAGSIVDGSYLGLVSDQGMRTTVIAGRPELGAPDWRGDVPGKAMSNDDISDVVAWLAAQRPRFPGQPYASALPSEGGIR